MKHALLLLAFLAFAQAPPYPTSLYYVTILRPVPGRKPLARDEADRLKTAHLANVHKMFDDGLLAAAGPFENDPAIDGIFVMKTKSADEARRVVNQDPMIRERRSVIDVHAWRAPAGIGEEYVRRLKEHPDASANLSVQPLMILIHGAAWNSTEPKQRVVPLANHILYIEKLHQTGKLAAAGQVEGDPEMAAIVVFHQLPLDEARRALDDDPAVKSGLLAVETHQWWTANHVLPW